MKSLATVLCIALASVLLLGVAPASAQNLDELTYAAVDPCRIVDTRFAVGAFQAGFTRSYNVYGNVVAQNGANAGNLYPDECLAPFGEPVAVSINVTAVSNTTGHLRVWAADILTRPQASMVNFTPGENIANQGAVLTDFNPGPAPVDPDIDVNPDIKIYASNATHVVVDVVGYWYPATNEIAGGNFQAGGAGLAEFDPPLAPGFAQRKFLTPPATVTVDNPNQFIHVVSSKALGSSFGAGGGFDLVLAICSENLGVPGSPLVVVGPGVGVAPGNAIAMAPGQTVLQSLNAGFGRPAGTYDVGLCGWIRGGSACAGCWDLNDAGYTTAFVVTP